MSKLYKINGELVTLNDLAVTWLAKATRFTSAPWSSPESKLEPGEFCSVCLIDLNEPGTEKVKANCKLPIRSMPGGAINTNALRAAAAALGGARGGLDAPAAAKQKAARTIVRLMRDAGIEPGEGLERLAGVAKGEVAMEFEIIQKARMRQVVYGIALRPNVPDSQGDVVSEEDVIEAAHKFMIDSRRADLQHQIVLAMDQATVVESFVVMADFEMEGKAVKRGDWLVGMKVFDAGLWGKIEAGDFRAFSIMGQGRRVPVAG